MLLTADIGNTNIVLAFYEGDKLIYSARAVTDPLRSEAEYYDTIKPLLDESRANLGGLEGSVISSVVPSLTGHIASILERLTGKKPLVIDADTDTGVNVRIGDPHELGNDLLAAAAAALVKYPKPIIIVDMGTATTFSAIDKNGDFLGVVIFPGVMLGYKALTAGAAQLGQAEVTPPDHVIGTNTPDSLMAGLFFGNAAMLDGVTERIEAEMGGKASLVATGGLAPLIVPHCRLDYILDRDLVPEGMRVIFERSRGE